MAVRNSKNRYTHAYKEQVYAVWYSQNRPNMADLYSLIEENDDGEKPSPATLMEWRRFEGWDDRANTTDIEVSKKTDRQLISMRMEMMTRHAARAQEVSDMAFEHLKNVGFDTSTSAVTALFKSFDEEKKSRGMEVALSQVFTLNDNDLQKTMARLLSRAQGLDVGEEGEEVIDAISGEEAPNE